MSSRTESDAASVARNEVHSSWCRQFRPTCCNLGPTSEGPCNPCRAAFAAGQKVSENEIERLRGLLDSLVHLHDTDRIVQAHKLLGRINAIVKSYQSPDATAGKLVERMQARKEST